MSELRDTARWLADQMTATTAAVGALSSPQLGTSSIEVGQVAEYDTDGTLVSVVGAQFDGTHAAVTLAGPVPPEPSPPTVTPGVGSVLVRWDGTFDSGELSPMDFHHVAVHASRQDLFEPDNTTQLATITGESGDTANILLDVGVWTFVLVAVSAAGKWSVPSNPTTAEVVDVQDPVTVQDTLIGLDTSVTSAQATADGKGMTYYQTTAPSPALAQDLWFDTTGGANTPKRFDGTNWVSVTDKVASDALAASNTATSTANTALNTANGKNKVTYSGAGPSGSGTTAGDLWFQTGTGNVVTGQWQWNGSAWAPQTLDSAVIASLDAGKLVAGTVTTAKLAAGAVTANELAANAVTAAKISAGAVTTAAMTAGTIDASVLVAGSITANTLSATAIDGKTITGASITGGKLTTTTTPGAVTAQIGPTAMLDISGNPTPGIGFVPVGSSSPPAGMHSNDGLGLYIDQGGAPSGGSPGSRLTLASQQATLYGYSGVTINGQTGPLALNGSTVTVNGDPLGLHGTYTPVLTASTTNPSIGSGTATGSYNLVGKQMTVEFFVPFGTGGSIGSGAYQISLPPGYSYGGLGSAIARGVFTAHIGASLDVSGFVKQTVSSGNTFQMYWQSATTTASLIGSNTVSWVSGYYMSGTIHVPIA